jgi:hypothetical protein
LIYYQSFI